MSEQQRILIVDDRPENLLALRQVLAAVDAEVIAAGSGNEALAASLHQDFALAILDVLMPGMDGYELAALLRGEPRTAQLPIVFLTATYEGREQMFQGYEAGAVDFLVKPYEPRVLLAKVRVFLALAQARAELAAARQAAEQASEAKSQFLAHMSHEIRTPLNAILGLAYLLEHQVLPDDAAELVAKLKGAGHTLLEIVNDVLDFSRIEAGRLRLEQAPFRLGGVLDNLAAIMAAAAGDKPLELIIAPPPPGVDLVLGDALRLGQVLINLAGNAIKFTDQGHVAVDIIPLTHDPQQVTLRFAVRDTGIGIGPEQQHAIFAPFAQADASTTRRFGGTGLGLSISRRLVELMGGEMGLVSAPGEGSEFWFTLPMERARNGLHATDLGQVELLIADDNAMTREALRRAAVSLGWPALVVDGGEAALAQALERRRRGASPRVLLLDWRMPGMDGLAAARAIRQALGEDHGPTLMMVAAHEREALLADPDAGLIDAVLIKPVTPSTLYDTVARVMRVAAGNAPPAPPAAAPQHLAGLHILVVDDSDINCEVAEAILRGEGAEVTTAGDGQAAVDWVQAHAKQIDLVLMDVQMPVLDGYQATRAIHASPGLGGLPVVALSAGAFHEQREAALAAGMSDFLPKPFEVDAMVACIRALTGRPAVPATAPPSQPAPTEELPGLALEQGLETWKDAAIYRRYLRKLAREYADVVTQMSTAEPTQAAALAHRLRGAAGNLGLLQVAEAALAAEQAIGAGAGAAATLADLQRTMDTALASIAAYAAAEVQAPPLAAAVAAAPTWVAELLALTLQALDTDSPDAAEALLAELAGAIPGERLEPLRAALEDFDFRAAEQAVRTLANDLGLALEAPE